MKELKNTVALMNSEDYKGRFKAEYYQTKIRYEKLKAFNTKIEAAEHMRYADKRMEEPKHDCPIELLMQQQSIMGEYLHLLEVRAVIEGISLDESANNPVEKSEYQKLFETGSTSTLGTVVSCHN